MRTLDSCAAFKGSWTLEHGGTLATFHDVGSFKIISVRHPNNRNAESRILLGSEFLNCRIKASEERRLCHFMSSQSKAGPSVFYILAVTQNPHPALNFPVQHTTFHVTHTNPAAISLSLNRAESLYLNSLAQSAAAVLGIAVTGWRGQK